jgi:protein-disulfide isomerase
VKDYGGKVRVAFKNFVVHPPVRKAHLAGCAAGKQGKFIEYKKAFWDKAWSAYVASRDIAKLSSDETLQGLATAAGIDWAKMKTDMDGPECAKVVDGDAAELQKWHVGGTPSFFVNGRTMVWTGDPASFKAAIDERLAAAAKSGTACGDYYALEVEKKGEQKFRAKGQPKPN